jgi:hypothetical protein
VHWYLLKSNCCRFSILLFREKREIDSNLSELALIVLILQRPDKYTPLQTNIAWALNGQMKSRKSDRSDSKLTGMREFDSIMFSQFLRSRQHPLLAVISSEHKTDSDLWCVMKCAKRCQNNSLFHPIFNERHFGQCFKVPSQYIPSSDFLRDCHFDEWQFNHFIHHNLSNVCFLDDCPRWLNPGPLFAVFARSMCGDLNHGEHHVKLSKLIDSAKSRLFESADKLINRSLDHQLSGVFRDSKAMWERRKWRLIWSDTPDRKLPKSIDRLS